MENLRNNFITGSADFQEGQVFVFGQKFAGQVVKKAKLTVTALGVYEVDLNGEKQGEQIFAPGYTYYPRRLFFQEYDLTNGLKDDNELRFYLGQGWYCGRFLFDNKVQLYGEKPGISWVLELEDYVGNSIILTSDEQVDELESPYEYAGMYDGEIYHAKNELAVIGKAVKYTEEIPSELTKTTLEVKVQEEVTVKTVTTHDGKTIIDFGQNFAGIVEINPEFLTNEKITIRHGELLNPDGSLYTTNLRKAKATTVYHAGDEKKNYRPRFTFMGFRYAELDGVEYQDGLLKAFAVYTDMERTGYFESGHELVNKLFENQVWGQKSNYVEIPTDCPQRDERMGYTGDGHVFAMTGAYNFNTNHFWENFLRDMELGQIDNTEGYIGSTVPAIGPAGIGFLSMLGWGNAVTIIPKALYWQYGNEEALLKQYDSMKLFVECEIRKMGDTNLWLGPSLGDWLAPGIDKDVAWHCMNNNPISNSFIVNDLEIMIDIAKRLGKTDDVERYANQLELTRKAYLDMFVTEDGIVANDYQSAYIMALQYVIQPGELREKAMKNFVDNVKRNGLETGFFATQFLLPTLVEAGEVELAYDILLNEGCPGWMYQIHRGATTTWERWDGIRPDGTVNEETMSDDNMVSFNHYAFGSVGQFYYQNIVGIQPAEPGYKTVRFAPQPDPRLGLVKGSYQSCAGLIESAWKYEDEKINFEFTTPVSAEILLPDGRIEKVLAGTHQFSCFSN